MIVVDESQCGAGIDVAPGETLAVRLREQGATGYQWTVEEVDALPLQDSLHVSGGDRPGAAGYREFRFQATTPGAHVLRFKRWREWAGEGSVVGRCELEVRVG